MSKITIENVGESPARKYGQTIPPGDKLVVSGDTILSYSAMEVARDLHAISEKLSSIENILAQERAESLIAKLENKPQVVHISQDFTPLQVETTPWIVRSIKRHFQRHRWKKEMR